MFASYYIGSRVNAGSILYVQPPNIFLYNIHCVSAYLLSVLVYDNRIVLLASTGNITRLLSIYIGRSEWGISNGLASRSLMRTKEIGKAEKAPECDWSRHSLFIVTRKRKRTIKEYCRVLGRRSGI